LFFPVLYIYNPLFNCFEILHQGLLIVKICFIIFLLLYAYFENTLKVFYQIVFVHGDYGTFRGFFFIQNRLRIKSKVFCRVRRISLKNIIVFGEYAKNILPYMENTSIDIKLSLSRRLFDKNLKNFRP
jgi:hypothetical protein